MGKLLLLPLLAVVRLIAATTATDLAGELAGALELAGAALTFVMLARLGLLGLGLRAGDLLVDRDALLEDRVEHDQLTGILRLQFEAAVDPVVRGEGHLHLLLDLLAGARNDGGGPRTDGLDGREHLHLLGEVQVALEASGGPQHRGHLRPPLLDVLDLQRIAQEVGEVGEERHGDLGRSQARDVRDEHVGHEAVLANDIGRFVEEAVLDQALGLVDVALELDLRHVGTGTDDGLVGGSGGLSRDLSGHECTSNKRV